MLILAPILLLAVLAVGFVVLRGLPVRRAVSLSAWVAGVVVVAASVGYVLGDAGREYRDEGISHLIRQTDIRLQAGDCEKVARAFRSAEVRRSEGVSPRTALGMAITELRSTDP